MLIVAKIVPAIAPEIRVIAMKVRIFNFLIHILQTLVAGKSCGVPHVVVEFVHPQIVKCRLSLSYAEEVSLVVSNHKHSKQHYPEQNANRYLWYLGYLYSNVFTNRRHVFR